MFLSMACILIPANITIKQPLCSRFYAEWLNLPAWKQSSGCLLKPDDRECKIFYNVLFMEKGPERR